MVIPKYSIRIEVKFRAGHRLMPPYKGKCNNPHGEGYTAIVEFATNQLDKNGMVFDFGDVKKQIKGWIDENWDHAYIHNPNDDVGCYLRGRGFRTFDMGSYGNPTAENMAKFLHDKIRSDITTKVTKVGIVESFEDSIAYYEEGDKNEGQKHKR